MEEYLKNLPSNCDSSDPDSEDEDEESSGFPWDYQCMTCLCFLGTGGWYLGWCDCHI